jgi:hypothetical protein
MDQIGFPAGFSLARVLGSMVVVVFTATLIIALTLNTVTTDRSLAAAKRRLITSTPTKREMAEAMSARLAMKAALSMLCPVEEAEAEAEVAASLPDRIGQIREKAPVAPFLFPRTASGA